MTTGILNETITVIANGSGNATAKLGPLTAREVWHPDSVAVHQALAIGTSPTNEAQCFISFGDANTKRAIDACVDGSTGDSTGRVSSITPKVGQYIWADWVGGDAGGTFVLTVTGSKDV